MISREEARNNFAIITNNSTMKIDSTDAQSLVDEIYDSIGSCEKCKYVNDFGKDYIYCNTLKISADKNWFCADFKPKENK